MNNIMVDNVNIDTVLLSDIITDLEKNNERIVSIINNIENAYKQLDDTRWKSREKTHFDEQVFHYINELKSSFCSDLNEYPAFLRRVIELYKENQEMSVKISDEFL